MISGNGSSHFRSHLFPGRSKVRAGRFTLVFSNYTFSFPPLFTPKLCYHIPGVLHAETAHQGAERGAHAFRDSSPSTHVNLGHGVTDFLDLEFHLFVADHFKKLGFDIGSQPRVFISGWIFVASNCSIPRSHDLGNLWRLQKLFDPPSAPPVRLRTPRKLCITSMCTCLWPECKHYVCGEERNPASSFLVASERNYFRIKIPICFYINFIYSNNW